MKNSLLTGLFVLITSIYYAQITGSEIKGLVSDNSKQAIPGVGITITHQPTGTVYKLLTDESGKYYLPQLKPGGPYTLLARYTGFQEIFLNDLFLELGEVKTLDFTLEEKSVNLETVTVNAVKNDPLSEKHKGAEININENQIGKLPTINRGIQDITRLSPQGTGNSFAGSNYRLNNLSIDGTANNDAFGFQEPGVGAGGSTAAGSPGSLSRTQPISLDAIGEIQVALSPYDVKLGNFTGSSINVVTKSGTNQMQSSIYSFGRNQEITGRSVDGLRSKIANYYDLQSGFRVGGALKQNKVFFFVNAEIGRRNEPVLYAPGSAGSSISFADAQALSDTLKARYNYDAGTIGDASIATRNNKLFLRLDWNLNEKTQLVLRQNFVDAQADNLLRAPTILNYGSQAHTHNSVTSSTVLEMKTKLRPRLFNNLILGFSRIHDFRETPGAVFPHIEITYNTSSTIFLGTYREATIFQMKQLAWELTDNLTWYKNKHKFTFGTHNEVYGFQYHFVTPFAGRWAYRSLTDFYNNQPSRIRGTYNLENDDFDYNYNRPSADFGILLSSVYAQDDYSITPRFSLTYGLRIDGNIFTKNQQTNEDVRNFAAFANHTQGIKSQVIFAPRVGFNWDIRGTKNWKIRGGSGIFAGRMPFAWAAYSYIYNGNQFGNIDIRPNTPVNLVTNDFGQLENIQPGRKEINLVAHDFKLPRVWRSNLATDIKFPGDFVFTVEGLFTKALYDAMFQTLNLKDSTAQLSGNGQDHRDVYLGSGTTQSINPGYTSVFLLTNTNKGYRYGIALSMSKKFAFGMNWTAAYNYGTSRDVMNGVRVSPQANWEWNQTINPNAPQLSYSNFDIRHRIISVMDYQKKWKKSSSLISFVFSSQSGSPFTFVYTGDLNRDGSPTNDLLYVPESASDINLVDITDGSGNVLVSKEAQWQQLDSYIAGNSYLNSRRGELTERNGARTPWNTQLDMRIAHDLQIRVGKKKHQLQLSADIINLTNLLYHKWGYQYFVQNTTNAGYSLLTVKSVNSSTGAASFQFNNPTTTPWQIDPIASRWQMQIGIRYSF